MEGQGYFVNVFDILRGNHRLGRDIAEEGDLLLDVFGEKTIGSTQHYVRLNTDLTKLLDRVLSRLGLQLSGSLHVGHQGEVDEHGVLTTHIVAELTNCLQKGQAFDVADGSTDLDNDHIDIILGPGA